MSNYPTLIAATPRDDFCLILDFGDGVSRLYDFKPNLTHKFYNALSDIKLFKAVRVSNGEIEWMSGQDFCTNTLYDNSKPIH